MREKIKRKMSEIREKLGLTNLIALIVWAYLLIKFDFARKLILGLLKFICISWVSCIGFIISMLGLTVLLFVVIMIGVKFKMIDKDVIDKLFNR